MTDMLVKLYNLPEYYPVRQALLGQGVELRKPFPSEKGFLVPWIGQHFAEIWAAECAAALDRDPINCFIAVEKQPLSREKSDPLPADDPYNLPAEKLLGFACFDVAKKGMFGPMAVLDEYRGRGIGKGLLLACLHDMKAQNYAYAVIWYVGPADFYAKTVGAVPIEGSAPGFYSGHLTGS
jgi:GNAT superfamily N-acetyltransferase